MSQIVFEREPGAPRQAKNFAMPRPIGRMMVALALLTILVAAASRYFGVTAATQPLAPVVAQRSLVLRDRADGGVDILDARTRQLVARLATVDDARFLRTLVRGLGTHVDRRDDSLDVTFTLTMREDGQLTASREGSARVNSINGFGLTQVATLQSLLVKR